MSDIYQSRVFTFISKQTNRLKDSCDRGLRHLKVAVVWTGQILLYPVRVLAHTAQRLTHQLPTPPTPPSLPQPAPHIDLDRALDLISDRDYPIEIINRQPLVVDDWSYIDENDWRAGHGNSAIASRELTRKPPSTGALVPPKPIVRGLSSLLRDRSIVLVTIENELLDILDFDRQQEIRRQIGVDLAVNWHQWHTYKIHAERERQQLSSRAELGLDRYHPVRVGVKPAEGTASPLGNRLAIASSNNIEPSQETLFDRFQNWLDSFKPQPVDPIVELTRDIPERNQPKSNPQLPAADYPFTPQPPRIYRSIPQRGRYANELPQLPPVVEDRHDRPVVDTLAKLPPDWLKQWWNYYRDYLYIPPEDERSFIDLSEDFQLIPIEEPKSKSAIVKTTSVKPERELETAIEVSKTNITKSKSPGDREYNPDWLDVESEDLGHSRSIFQKILMWLDELMLKIENWLIRIWEIITNKAARN